MATRTITTKLALEGEAEYRAKIKNINSELAVYKSELERVEAKYKTSANSLEALSAKQSALKGQLDALNKKHDEQAEMLEKARKAQQKFAEEADSVRAKLESLKGSSADTAEEQEKLAKQLADAEESMQKAANSANFYQKQLNNTERDQEKLGQELEQTGKYLAEAESDFYKCAKSIDKYGHEVKDAGDASKELGESSREAINQLAGVLASAGVAKAVEEIAAALLECVKAFGEFESQMSAVQAISGASGTQMAELAEKAKYMGATTSFTATEAGQALEYMAMAGWKTNEMMDGLEGIMHLAAASGEDLGATSDIVTDALTAFGLAASDSARFADVLAAASSNANTNVGMMGETFKYAAPVAGSLGYSIEDTALAIGLMANAGIKGTQAGTALRSVFSRLASDAGATKTQLGALGVLTERLGVQFYNIDGSTRALNDVLVDSRAAWAGLSAEEQIFYGKTIAGTEAMSGWLALMNAGEADFQKLSLAISNSSGAAKEMSEIKLDNLSGQMTLLGSAADGLKIAIGEQLAPALSGLAEVGTGALAWATDFVSENPWLVQAIAGALGALGLLATGLAAYTALTTAAAAAQTALNGAIGLCPLAAVTVAAGALVGVIGSWVASLDDVDEKTQGFTDSLKDSKDAYEDLNDSMADQRRNNRAMASSLLELLKVEEKSALQKDQIEQKVAKLNEAVPELNLAYDREADALIGVTEAELKSMLAREEAQTQYEAQVSRLNELSTERAEIESRLKDARLALNEAEAAGTGNTRELQNTINDLTAAQEENERQTAALEEASSAYGEAQAQAAAKSKDAQARVQELTDQMAQLDEAHQKSMEAARANLERQMGLFEDLDKSANISINDMIESLKKQEEATNSYAENIQKAMELGVDKGLIQKLSDGSDESARILAEIVASGEEEISALNDEFRKVEQGKDDFTKVIDELENDYSNRMDDITRKMNESIAELNQAEEAWTVGQNNIQGLINGVTSKTGALMATYVKAARDALNAYAREMDQHSPSKKFYKMGRFDIEGLILGVESEESKLAATYARIGRAGLNSLKQNLPSHGIDYDTDVDYSSLMLAAETLEEFEQYAAQRTAKIIGEHIDLVEQGYSDNTQLLKQWMESVGATAEDVEGIIQNIEKTIQGIDYDPDVDYSSLMLAAETLEEFEQYAAQRTAKIIGEHIDLVEQGYSDNTQLLKQWMESVGATAEDVEGIIQNIEKTIQGIDYDPDVDYSSLMLAAETLEEFEQYAAQRTAKIIGEHIDTVAQGYADNAKILEQWRSTVDQTMSGIEKSVNGVSYDPNIDYSALMMEAKSVEEFLELANKRSAKIAGENIDVVARGYADNIQLLEQWSSAIKESRDDLVRTADDMAAEFSEKMEEITKSLNDAIQEMNVKEEAFQVGTDNIRGLIDGTLDMKNELVDTYAQMGREALAAYKKEVDQRSPSHKFEQAGRFDIQGLIRGAEEEKNNLDAAYAKLAQTALNSMERHLPSTLAEPPSTAAQDRQTAAIIAAVSNRGENAGGIPIHIDKLVVRDESDVKRIAQELYYMVQREGRSRGGGFL